MLISIAITWFFYDKENETESQQTPNTNSESEQSEYQPPNNNAPSDFISTDYQLSQK
jgi:hypothetical protein